MKTEEYYGHKIEIQSQATAQGIQDQILIDGEKHGPLHKPQNFFSIDLLVKLAKVEIDRRVETAGEK
jgi:hypothetical protein